jgi:hypothetical protein
VSFARIARAWLTSVLACFVALAGWVVAMQVLSGRMDHLWHNMLDMSTAFAAVFAITALVVYVPVFGLLARFRRSISRADAIVVGAALGLVPYLAVALAFRDSDGPRTLGGLVAERLFDLPVLAIGVLPFAAAGSLFGACAAGRSRAAISRRVERAI